MSEAIGDFGVVGLAVGHLLDLNMECTADVHTLIAGNGTKFYP
jgi:hypothetical protein